MMSDRNYLERIREFERYAQLQRETRGERCIFCDKTIKTLRYGLCHSHYDKWMRTGRPSPENFQFDIKSTVRNAGKLCDCGEPCFLKGMCRKHYYANRNKQKSYRTSLQKAWNKYNESRRIRERNFGFAIAVQKIKKMQT